MEEEKKTSNMLLVVMAAMLVAVGAIGIMAEYIFSEDPVRIVFRAPPWSVKVDAVSDEGAAFPSAVKVNIENRGRQTIYGHNLVLLFDEAGTPAVIATPSSGQAAAFSIEGGGSKEISADLGLVRFTDVEGNQISLEQAKQRLNGGEWGVHAAFLAVGEHRPASYLATSERVRNGAPASAKKMAEPPVASE